MKALVDAVQIREKFLESRRLAKFMQGEDWEKTYLQYKEIVENCMNKNNCDILQAVIIISEHISNNPMMIMMLFVTAAEMLEPEVKPDT